MVCALAVSVLCAKPSLGKILNPKLLPVKYVLMLDQLGIKVLWQMKLVFKKYFVCSEEEIVV